MAKLTFIKSDGRSTTINVDLGEGIPEDGVLFTPIGPPITEGPLKGYTLGTVPISEPAPSLVSLLAMWGSSGWRSRLTRTLQGAWPPSWRRH